MYLLDTNVVSELRKSTTGKINRNVDEWAKQIPSSDLFISVITILELEIGILQVERRDKAQGHILRIWLNDYVLPTFSERIMNIDLAVVQRCAKLHVPDPCSDRDALIAATAFVHHMTVVTRNVVDFEATGVGVFNPWE